ncbi:MAG: helix-turn-helix domain-containing protein [Actinomycetota bacterium]|nr:helix-turn-helix domain-containing protein [Actinomycetota bacterium]
MAPPIGKRIAQARKAAGWTQAQLSQRTHFSVQLVSTVEQGRKPASHAFATAAARALHADLHWLLGQDQVHRQHDPNRPGAPAAELRAVMDAWDDPGIDAPPAPLPELEAGLTRAEQLRRLGRYDGVLAAQLPELLRALYVHARDAVPGTQVAERTQARLCDAYSIIQSVANRYGLVDVVGQAVDRHVTAARLSGDPLRPAVAAYRRVAHQLRWGYFDAAQRSLTRAQDGIADVPGPVADAVRVQLALRASVAAARTGDLDAADELVADARGRVAATELPEAPYPNLIASALNVDMHWMAVAMEASDGTTALTRARQVVLPDKHADQPNRIAHYWLDLARAWLLHGNRTAASTHWSVPERSPTSTSATTRRCTRRSRPWPRGMHDGPTAWPGSSAGPAYASRR